MGEPNEILKKQALIQMQNKWVTPLFHVRTKNDFGLAEL